MAAALDPELAIAYVRELSADVRAVVVLDAEGNRLAGPEPLAQAARALAFEGVAVAPGGTVTVARYGGRVLVAVAAPGGLAGPTHRDALAALGASGEPPSPVRGGLGPGSVEAVEHVIAAT
jgi:hypothetical protein